MWSAVDARLSKIFEVLFEDGWLNVRAGELAMRPPGAPTDPDKRGRVRSTEISNNVVKKGLVPINNRSRLFSQRVWLRDSPPIILSKSNAKSTLTDRSSSKLGQ